MTITLTREEAQQVLDALEYFGCDFDEQLIETLRTRLAQPEPSVEPVAWMLTELDGTPLIDCGDLVVKPRPVLVSDKTDCIPLYTAPPQRDEPEPVSWVDWDEHGDAFLTIKHCGVPLYTAPPQRKEWQGLTLKDMMQLCASDVDEATLDFARAIEGKLREKNA